jgi:hypothetical protein
VETLVIHGFLHLCGYDHEKDQGEMLALQAQLEQEFLDAEPLPMALRRGRKPGSKVKVLKDGSKVVVTGRAAAALRQKEAVEKVAARTAASKAKGRAATSKDARLAAEKPKRGPGRPRKARPDVVEAPARRVPRRRKAVKPRSGVIA